MLNWNTNEYANSRFLRAGEVLKKQWQTLVTIDNDYKDKNLKVFIIKYQISYFIQIYRFQLFMLHTFNEDKLYFTNLTYFLIFLYFVDFFKISPAPPLTAATDRARFLHPVFL